MPAAHAVSQPPAAEAVEAGQMPVKRKRKKNLAGFFIGAGAVLAILCIAAAVVMIFLSGGNKLKSPQAVLDRVVDTILDGDYGKALDCIYEYHYSPALRQEAADDIASFSAESFESFGIDKDTVKSLLSLQVKHQETVGPQDEEAIRKTLTDSGVTTDPIEEIVRAEVEIGIFGEKTTVDLFFIKADGGWYLLISENPLSDADASLFE